MKKLVAVYPRASVVVVVVACRSFLLLLLPLLFRGKMRGSEDD